MGPVERVGAVRQVESARKAADVSPAFGVAGAGRLQDDSYGDDASGQDRGMEEDAPQEEEHVDKTEQATTAEDKKIVNLLA